MTAANHARWTPGTDLPYVLALGGGEDLLAIRLPAAWLKADRSGQPLLLPPAVRALDRLRALFGSGAPLTPGFVVSLRQAMRLTQAEFGRRLGVSKMTVSRWECGRMKPGASSVRRMRKLQAWFQRSGTHIDGARLALTHHSRVRRLQKNEGRPIDRPSVRL